MKSKWRKSSYSSAQGNCAEIASNGRHVLIRDTQDLTGPVLRFAPDAWRKFAVKMKHSRQETS